ncbi:hypothetical protein BJX99DRAFT_271076 [Aspergillus californicus]
MTFTHGSYTVAWICYLPMEIMAAKEILDELHPTLPQPISDNTSYILGSASGHNVVVVCLSASIFRTNISTASSLSHFISTYTNIEFGLIFGIGGGIPRENFDIRLGDIVVSKPTNTSSGVIQYTYDETLQRGRAYPTGSPNKSSLLLPKVIHQMESDHMLGKHISTLASNPRIVDVFSRPSKDRLFQPTYEHLSGSDCTMCDQSQLVDRPKRVAEEPHIHYGLIASGKRVIRDGITRDRVARELDVLSFDWEAAGLIKEFPILVIRGICDYCDSHRGVEWQKYASLVAAIYAKTLLSVVPASQRELPKPEKGEKDSGYSSLPTRFNKGHVQAGEGNDLHFHSSDADVERINNIRGNDDRDMDEVSIYTAGLDIHPAKKEAYISSFADNLLDKTLTVQSDQESVDRIHEALPGLLKTFALKVGSSETTQIYRDVMVFVRKYRREIARKFRDKYSEDNRTRTNILGNDMTRLQLEDRVSKWSPDLDFLEDPNTAFNEIPDDIMDDTDSEDMEEAERATDTLPEASIYKAFISGLPAFKCLLESIQNVLHRGVPGDVATNIKEQILEYLPSTQRVSRREAPQRHTVEFTAEWDLCVFLREQEYLENLETAMERAITITGSPLNAQAATTTQYMTQTWPSSGIHLLHVLKQIVRDNFTRPHSCKLTLTQDKFPDGTHVCARCRGPEFTAEVVGIAESIAEFGEQLAWLASALRSSPYEMGITVVSAFISGIWVEKSIDVNGNTTSSFSCNIDFTMDTINDSEESLNGQCWHHLFRNPVIVKGYPIPRRPISTPGLEIALDTMAGLAGTHRINIFSNRIFIKEFSTMLIPTRFSENIISWHLLYKKNGDRISYLESSESHAENITLLDLEKSRHVLGWSSNVRNLAGTADANYMIERSWLRALHEDCRLKGIAVSQGRLIKSDHTSAFGKRDRSQQIARSTYRAKLYALSKRYVVLWDVAYKRGWLLNGTTALLHLLRASLEFNKTDDLAFAFLLGPGKLQEATNPNSASAAIEVLMNPENLNLELYDDSERGDSYADGKYRVRDRVNDLYETLDQIVDYQTLIAGEGGEGLKFAPRKDLEGWDFKDISTTEDPIYPCLAKLKTIGKGWVDLTRAIQAVSLFGRGFGSLIDPIEKGDTCIHWQALPSNKYYLAARMEDISRIMDRLGHPRMNPPRLTKSIVWYPVSKEHSMKCDCSNDIRKHCQLSHMTWPLHMSQKLPQSPRSAFGGTAAVVFGHNTNTGWIWNDVGDPEKGEPSLSEEESDDNDPVDSGIGSSAQSENITSIHLLEHRHYKIAIICALPKELMAVRALFDDNHRPLPQRENDSNTYALGRLGSHNVVAACLPSEEYGMNAASKVASDMQKSFAAVRWYFVVGIGGGVPSEKHDIRLGDVVVSTGVIQHDMGKAIQKDSSFQNTANLQRPARSLMTAISLIRSDPILEHNFLDTHLHHILSLRPEYKSPGKDHDRLFQPEDCHEDGGQTCENCKGPEVPRSNRPQGPHIHYGCIASGNQVIKDAILRDRLSAEMKVLCFEMEGAGVMTSERCLVIRGVCDYADSHKNDEWHYYAAATAAAYTKAFLLHTRNFDKPDREWPIVSLIS